MQDLTVIGIENRALVVASESGERYRVPIDEVLQSRLRQTATLFAQEKRISPRLIQNQIRAGISTKEIAQEQGVPEEYIERFEGPVLAERQHIISSAMKVAVTLDSPLDPLGEDTTSAFGDVMNERLRGLEAKEISWSSWKEEGGWLVKLSFSAAQIDHDARWQYDPKRHSLSPVNAGAITLSQQGEIKGGLIPRLRAVGFETTEKSFPQPELPNTAAAEHPVHGNRHAGAKKQTHQVSDLPHTPTTTATLTLELPESTEAKHNDTADLLDALRRRRGERETASFVEETEEEGAANHRPVAELKSLKRENSPSVTDSTTKLVLEGLEEDVPPAPPAKSSRRSRKSMPSWDEIVFGARSESDESSS